MSKLWFWREEVSSTTTWVHHVEGDMSLVLSNREMSQRTSYSNLTHSCHQKINPFKKRDHENLLRTLLLASSLAVCVVCGRTVPSIIAPSPSHTTKPMKEQCKCNPCKLAPPSQLKTNQSFGSKTPLQYFSAIDRFNLSADGTTTTTLRLQPLES